jgi:hypothetical protein
VKNVNKEKNKKDRIIVRTVKIKKINYVKNVSYKRHKRGKIYAKIVMQINIWQKINHKKMTNNMSR